MKIYNQIDYNVRSYNKTAHKYFSCHDEIFNPIEQRRLSDKLRFAVQRINSDAQFKMALDYGCGSGNITGHLIDLGIKTTASDVSNNFLYIVKNKYQSTKYLSLLKINGYDLSNIKDNKYDMVATYSVLHHVPDYLQIIKEMVRVLKPGGIIFLDHEVNESYWAKDEKYIEFIGLVGRRPRSFFQNLCKLFRLSTYFVRIKKIINPRYMSEGDIHVWPDDHIEWDKIEYVLRQSGCKKILIEDYLLYKDYYPIDIYNIYRKKCNDMRLLVYQKKFNTGLSVMPQKK